MRIKMTAGSIDCDNYQGPFGGGGLLPPVLDRSLKISRAIVNGAISGGEWYLAGRCVAKINILNRMAGHLFSPDPVACILVGVATAAIVETASLVHDVAKHALGDRAAARDLNLDSTAMKCLRHRSWKVISHVEKVPRQIDVIFSRALGIRTAAEIEKIPEDIRVPLSFLEIVRFAFLDTANEVLFNDMPKWLSEHYVGFLGYNTVNLPLKIKICGVVFRFLHIVNTELNKVNAEENKNELIPIDNKHISLEASHDDDYGLRELFTQDVEREKETF